MTALTADGAPAAPRLPLRHVAAVAAGNALEFYDFLTYAFFAAQIGRTFFPSTSVNGSLLPALATFGAGFLMRPVGALVLGFLADRIGRKPAMLISFSLMGSAMLALALIPSYASIGILAPILLIICRLVQGFALGGEIGPSTAYLVEAAPPERRGLYASLQYMGQDIAVLAAGIVGFCLANALTPASLDAWGWRVALGIGVVIVPFGLMLRSTLVETLNEAEHAKAHFPPPPASTGAFVWLVVLGLMMLAGGTTVSYVLTYLTTYATTTLHMSEAVGFAATIVLGLFGVICDPIGGWLADRYGRRWVMIIPTAILLILTVPAFTVIAQLRSLAAVIGMTALLSITASLGASSVLVSLTERLPHRARSGALGLIYALAISVFGGSTQWTVTKLTELTHSNLAPAWYMTGGIAVALLAMILLPSLPRNARSPA